WGNSVQVAILLGLSLALSSTAMVMQWLQEKSLFTTPAGKSSFSILLLQDLAVIPILFLLTIFAADSNEAIFSFISVSLFKMAIAVLIIYFAGRLIVKHVFLFANRYGGPEVFVAFSLLIIVTSASVAHYAGLSMALGAFIAGLLLAETEYRHEVSSFIIPFKSLLLGIFFFSFGMGINLEYIGEKPFWLFASVIGLMSIKAVIIYVLCKLWKQTNAVAAESAILLSQAGEFGLLVVGSALTASLIAEDIGQFMLITVGLTMFVTPIITPLARKVGQFVEEKEHEKNNATPADLDQENQHIVIFGYGRVGRNIGNKLCSDGFSIIGFDNNVEKVKEFKEKSYPVFFGKAENQSTLKAANLDNALSVVITIDDEKATKKIASLVRKANKNIPIIVRAHSQSDVDALEKLKNIDVVNEDTLISDELTKVIFEQCLPFSRK
ncbi:MAG: cation:proton antiporter, partial [Pseudomonadota bacterium]